MIFYILITILVILLTYAFVKTQSKFNHWADKGVKTAPSCIPIFGHQFNIMVKPMRWLYNARMYKEYKSDGVWGMYEMGGTPNLHVCDLDIIRDVLVKESEYFIDRRYMDFNDEYFQEFLTLLEGERWKAVRSILSPTFSSGKIKGMFSFIKDKAKDLITRSKSEMKEVGYIDGKEMISLFTMDVIATCAFGLDIKCLLDKDVADSRFMKTAKDIMAITMLKVLKFVICSLLPMRISKAIGFKLFEDHYAAEVIRSAYEERIKSGFRRGDYLDLLIEAKAINDKDENKNKSDFSLITVISESLLFLLAGFDTTSSAISFVIYCLAKNPSKQDTLREHLKEILETEGEFSYQNIMECQYLEAVVNETLRFLPVAFLLERRCVRDFKVKSKDFTIEKGTMVTIPAFSIHRDSQYWDEPEEFRPERFLPENKGNIVPFTYMPFGLGPRNCIAMRFALLEVKLCIAELCTSFEMNLAEGSEELVFDHSAGGVMKPTAGSMKVELNSLESPDA